MQAIFRLLNRNKYSTLFQKIYFNNKSILSCYLLIFKNVFIYFIIKFTLMFDTFNSIAANSNSIICFFNGHDLHDVDENLKKFKLNYSNYPKTYMQGFVKINFAIIFTLQSINCNYHF